MARAMLISANLKEFLWAEAVNTAAYLRNRAPTRALDNITPYEVWNNRKPNVKHFKIFGSLAIALNKKRNNKFKAKGKEYVLVGYSSTSKAYRLYDKETRNIIISRDVCFIEKISNSEAVYIPIAEEGLSRVVVDHVQEQENNKSDENNKTEISSTEKQDAMEGEPKIGPGRPRILRTGQPGRPKKYYNEVNFIQQINENIKVPESVDEALNSQYSTFWWDAMQEEYRSLVRNGTWRLVDLPQGQRVIGCKWVFAIKRDRNGNIERFKARLVAKGYAQEYGINYTETFSPVVRYETIRMIIALAAEYRLHLHQMDVSTAYLNSKLDDDVFMSQPECFVNNDNPGKVLKLEKALYGLKQSGRQWNQTIDAILVEIGFKACGNEPCLYVRNDGESINLIAVYVDDLLLASSDVHELNRIKKEIAKRVDVVDKGPAGHFLISEIERKDPTGDIFVHQKNFVEYLLKTYGVEECRPVSTPLEPKYQVTCNENSCKRVCPREYQSLIGSLMYLAVCSRPDIIHSVSKLSQKNTDPHLEHMTAARRILKYVNRTKNMGLKYFRTGKPLTCYVDADWGGDTDCRKSYTGYSFILAGSVFSWETKKQATVALSSTEAEYMALSSAAKEAVYLKKLFEEIKLHCIEKIEINGDNLGALHLVKNPIYHNRTKHIDIRYHHIRDVYKRGLIELKYCCSNENIADIFTKNLPKVSHEHIVRNLGLVNMKQ